MKPIKLINMKEGGWYVSYGSHNHTDNTAKHIVIFKCIPNQRLAIQSAKYAMIMRYDYSLTPYTPTHIQYYYGFDGVISIMDKVFELTEDEMIEHLVKDNI